MQRSTQLPKTARNRPTRRRPQRRRQPQRYVVDNPPLQVGSGQFVPKSTRVSLRFAATSDEKTASFSEIRVSGNNIVDPLGSTGTGAPVGFTYWASMYERYRVIGSRFNVYGRVATETKDSGTAAVSAKLIAYPSNNTTTLSSGSDHAAQPFARQVNVTTATPNSISMTMKSGTILGQKDVLGPDRLQAIINTGPVDEWFWRAVLVFDTDMSTSTNHVLSFDVTYDVEFFDRKPLDRSSVAYYHRLAWLENCRLIEEEHKLAQAQRDTLSRRLAQQLAEHKVPHGIRSENKIQVETEDDTYVSIKRDHYSLQSQPSQKVLPINGNVDRASLTPGARSVPYRAG